MEVMSKLGPETMDVTDAIEIFSRRGAAAALTIAKNSQRIGKFNEAMRNADGTVRNSAKIIEEGLGDSFRQLSSAVAEATLAVGEGGFGSAVQSLVQFLTEGVRTLTDFENGVTRVGAAAALLIATLGIAGLTTVIIRLVTAIKAATVAAGGFLALISKHPIMLAVTAVVALGSAIIGMADDSNFASRELQDFNRTLGDLSVNLESIRSSFEQALALDDTRKQVQAISSLRSAVGNLREDMKKLDPTEMIDVSRFTELRTAIMELTGMEGFRAVTAEQQLAQAQTPEGRRRAVSNIAPMQVMNIRRELQEGALASGAPGGGRGARAMQPSAAMVEIPQVRARDAAEQAVAVMMMLQEHMDALRDSAKEAGPSIEGQVSEAAKEKTVRDELIKMHSILNEELVLERLELEKGSRVRAAFADQLSVLKDLERETKLGRDELIAKYGEELDVLRQLMIEREKVTEKQKQKDAAREEAENLAEGVAQGIVQPLTQGILSGDFREVGVQMYMNVVSAILQEMAMKPLMDEIKGAVMTLMGPGTAAANGMALSGGVQRFAKGGVVGGPTTFGMAGGRTGLMGEAGPEDIMPLKRLPSGKLGIEAQGGGTIVNDNRRITIQVKDDAGMRRTMRQLDRDTARRIDEGTR